MKVKVSGFQWSLSNKLSLDDLMGHIAGKVDEEIPFDGHQRMIYVADHETSYSGLVLTIRDHKTFCRMQGRGRQVRIAIGRIAGDEHITEVNLFAVRKDTQRGLYMHYHTSLSLSSFQTFMRRHYGDARAELIAEAKEAKDRVRLNKLKLSPRSLSWSLLTQTKGFKDLVAELNRVNDFEYNADTNVVKEGRYRSMLASVKGESRRVRFIRGTPPGTVAAQLDALVKDLGIERGTVHGEDAEGADRIVKLVNNAELFDEWDFDNDVTPFLDNLIASEFYTSDLVTKLVEILDNNAVLLTRPRE